MQQCSNDEAAEEEKILSKRPQDEKKTLEKKVRLKSNKKAWSLFCENFAMNSWKNLFVLRLKSHNLPAEKVTHKTLQTCI